MTHWCWIGLFLLGILALELAALTWGPLASSPPWYYLDFASGSRDDPSQSGHTDTRQEQRTAREATTITGTTGEPPPAQSQNGLAARSGVAPESSKMAECELAAQQSMADATIWLNRAAWVGVVLTVVGLALLLRTMIYARDAAHFAGQAVGAAAKADEIARRAVRPIPFLALRTEVGAGASQIDLHDLLGVWLKVDIYNAGQTPCVVRARGIAVRRYDGKEPTKMRDKMPLVLKAGDTLRDIIRDEMVFPRRTEYRRYTCSAFVDYEDVVGIVRRRDFVFKTKSRSGIEFVLASFTETEMQGSKDSQAVNS